MTESLAVTFLSGDVLPCDRCAATERVIIVARHDGDANKLDPLIALCVDCLAQGIEDVTGWRVTRQFAAWAKVRVDPESARRRRNQRKPGQSRRTSPTA